MNGLPRGGELASPEHCHYACSLLDAQSNLRPGEWMAWYASNWGRQGRCMPSATANLFLMAHGILQPHPNGSSHPLRSGFLPKIPFPVEASRKSELPLHMHSAFSAEAPVRPCTPCMPVVDGKCYFDLVAWLFKAAKRDIYISGWYFSHHVYLRRDPLRDRLDQVLLAKAIEGVRVRVLLWDEVEMARNMNYGKSFYNKQMLEAMHPNIQVITHPEIAHLIQGVSVGALDDAAWSHHQKFVVVDQAVAVIGGLDLLVGRWDDHNHFMADPDRQTWLGLDYVSPFGEGMADS